MSRACHRTKKNGSRCKDLRPLSTVWRNQNDSWACASSFQGICFLLRCARWPDERPLLPDSKFLLPATWAFRTEGKRTYICSDRCQTLEKKLWWEQEMSPSLLLLPFFFWEIVGYPIELIWAACSLFSTQPRNSQSSVFTWRHTRHIGVQNLTTMKLRPYWCSKPILWELNLHMF